MIFPPFNENVDYCTLSLTSEIALKRQTHEYTEEDIVDGHDIQKEIYRKLGFGNEHWYKWWCGIMNEAQKLTLAKKEIASFINLNSQEGGAYANTWFITINCKPDMRDVKLIVSVIDNLMQCDWIKAATWIYENYTEDGQHIHIHAKIEIKQKTPKSIIVQKICKTKGMAKLLSINQGRSSTYVDVKSYEHHHNDYIDLFKTPAKAKYLDMDAQFRKDNNLKIKYSTNV